MREALRACSNEDMDKPTATEAAEVIARDVRAFAARTGQPITLALCEARVSEARHTATPGTMGAAWAALANPRTVYRIANR